MCVKTGRWTAGGWREMEELGCVWWWWGWGGGRGTNTQTPGVFVLLELRAWVTPAHFKLFFVWFLFLRSLPRVETCRCKILSLQCKVILQQQICVFRALKTCTAQRRLYSRSYENGRQFFRCRIKFAARKLQSGFCSDKYLQLPKNRGDGGTMLQLAVVTGRHATNSLQT